MSVTAHKFGHLDWCRYLEFWCLGTVQDLTDKRMHDTDNTDKACITQATQGARHTARQATALPFILHKECSLSWPRVACSRTPAGRAV